MTEALQEVRDSFKEAVPAAFGHKRGDYQQAGIIELKMAVLNRSEILQALPFVERGLVELRYAALSQERQKRLEKAVLDAAASWSQGAAETTEGASVVQAPTAPKIQPNHLKPSAPPTEEVELHEITSGDQYFGRVAALAHKTIKWGKYRWRFELAEYLGSGNTSAVFALRGKPDRALKLPISRGDTLFLDFEKGSRLLRRAGVPAVEIFQHNDFGGWYAEVERIQTKPLLIGSSIDTVALTAELFFKQNYRSQLSDFEVADMKDKLVEFGVSLAPFEVIVDFGPDQVLWDDKGKRWVLADWAAPHRLASPKSKTHPFNPVIKDRVGDAFEQSLKEQINRAVLAKRASPDYGKLVRSLGYVGE